MVTRTPKRFLFALGLVVLSLAWVEFKPALGEARNEPRQQALPSWPANLPKWPTGPYSKPAARGAADLVVLVSIDGLRPDAISPSMKSMQRLFLQGASARVARTIHKSATLPSHASMVSGVEPSEHGIDFNSYEPEHTNIRRPTVFSIAHEAGLPTYMFVGKAKLRHLLLRPSDAQVKTAGIRCKHLVKESLPQILSMKRGLVFLHFADPDSAGHRNGWMSDEYMEAVRSADECVEQVMDAIEKGGRMARTLLLVTSDHGGHNHSHGTRMEVDQRIPWYAWGANAKRGRVQRDVHTTDTAATVLAALGLAVPAEMRGQPVAEAIGAALGPLGMPMIGSPVEAAQ